MAFIEASLEELPVSAKLGQSCLATKISAPGPSSFGWFRHTHKPSPVAIPSPSAAIVGHLRRRLPARRSSTTLATPHPTQTNQQVRHDSLSLPGLFPVAAGDHRRRNLANFLPVPFFPGPRTQLQRIAIILGSFLQKFISLFFSFLVNFKNF